MKLDEANKKLKATQNEIETVKKDFQVMIKQYQVRDHEDHRRESTV